MNQIDQLIENKLDPSKKITEGSGFVYHNTIIIDYSTTPPSLKLQCPSLLVGYKSPISGISREDMSDNIENLEKIVSMCNDKINQYLETVQITIKSMVRQCNADMTKNTELFKKGEDY